MRNTKRLALALVLLSLLLYGLPVAGQTPVGSPTAAGDRYAPGEMVLKLRPGAATRLNQYRGMAILERIPGTDWVRVAVPSGKELDRIAAAAGDPDVVEALPNTLVSAAGTPNDPYFSQQWGLTTVRAPLAWEATMGAVTVTIAVLDTGIDFSHPDLGTCLWVNPGEVPGNGVDDDGDGLADDVNGWNYIAGNANPQDDNGHGSHVSGIAAATTNNEIGVAGMAPGSRLMILKVLDNRGLGSYFNVALAIHYAADHGARIVSMSLAADDDGGSLAQEAVDYARAKGLLVVAAAGNYAEAGNPVMYPAALPGVVSVAATDQTDNTSSYSEYNSYVDIAAPGTSILSTTLGGYTRMRGTSMATPFVSGVAALVWSLQPSWTSDQVEAHLKATAAKVGGYPYEGGRNDHFGAGRLDAAAAVWQAGPPPTLTTSPEAALAITGDAPATRIIRVTSNSPLPVSVTAVVFGGGSWLSVSPAEAQVVSAGRPVTVALSIDTTGQPFGLLQASVQFRTNTPYAAVFPADVPVRVTHAQHLYRTGFQIYIDWQP